MRNVQAVANKKRFAVVDFYEFIKGEIIAWADTMAQAKTKAAQHTEDTDFECDLFIIDYEQKTVHWPDGSLLKSEN